MVYLDSLTGDSTVHFVIVLFLAALPSLTFAQAPPSPQDRTSTTDGAASNRSHPDSETATKVALAPFKSLTTNIAGQGVPGFYGPFMVYDPQTTYSPYPTFRVQKTVANIGADLGTLSTNPTIWGLVHTAPNQAGYEWATMGEVHNKTLGTTGAQHVGVYGGIFKESTPGVAGSIGPSWGMNAVCDDRTREVSPIYSCIGIEVDVATNAAGGDPHRQRVGMQIGGVTSNTDPSNPTHFGYAIMVGAGNNAVVDRAISLRPGNFGIGYDTAAATLAGPAFQMAAGQILAVDANDAGDSKRHITYNSGNLLYKTPFEEIRFADDGTIYAAATDQTALQLKPAKVATLPLCNAALKGRVQAISDGAGALAWGATLKGGGSTYYTVNCNGNTWAVMGK